jgi:hypothetical protein
MDNDTDVKMIYQIKVSGTMDKRWVGWFDEMQITTEMRQDGNPITVLTGPVIDQVALRGLITKLWDLNIELISVQRKEDDADDKGENPDETDD